MKRPSRSIKAQTLRPQTPKDGGLKHPLRDNRGMAMVLTLSAVVLLSLLVVWLVVQSGSTFRIMKSVQRRDTTFNLAEAALQLSWQCLRTVSSEKILLNLEKKKDVTPANEVPYMVENQPLGLGKLTPRITFLDTDVVPGWDMSKFRGYYYLARGQGTQSVPAQKGGDAHSEVMIFVQKVGQIRSR